MAAPVAVVRPVGARVDARGGGRGGGGGGGGRPHRVGGGVRGGHGCVPPLTSPTLVAGGVVPAPPAGAAPSIGNVLWSTLVTPPPRSPLSAPRFPPPLFPSRLTRRGMSQTGVPFGTIRHVTGYLGIPPAAVPPPPTCTPTGPSPALPLPAPR